VAAICFGDCLWLFRWSRACFQSQNYFPSRKSAHLAVSAHISLHQCIPTFSGLWHTDISFAASSGHLWQFAVQGLMKISKFIFNDILKNVSTRGTPEYCEWHSRVPRHPGWDPLVCTSETINITLWRIQTKPGSVHYFAVVVLATNKTCGAFLWRISVFSVIWSSMVQKWLFIKMSKSTCFIFQPTFPHFFRYISWPETDTLSPAIASDISSIVVFDDTSWSEAGQWGFQS